MDILKANPKSSTISLDKDGSWSESNAAGIANYFILFITMITSPFFRNHN